MSEVFPARAEKYWCAIVLNWEGTRETLRCVASINKAVELCPDMRFRGIVVDNGSTPGTLGLLADQINLESEWSLLRLSENLGFSAGMNAGIREAVDAKTSAVILLNNDAILDRDAFRVLISHHEAHPESDVTGLVVEESASRCVAGFRYYTWLGAATPVVFNPKRTETAPRIDYPCGSAILLSGDFIRRNGGLPQVSFLYFEELRLMRQLSGSGNASVCLGAKIRHESGTSTRKLSRPSRHYYAAHACFKYTMDYARLALPTVAAARFVRLAVHAISERNIGPLLDGYTALVDCLKGREKRPA